MQARVRVGHGAQRPAHCGHSGADGQGSAVVLCCMAYHRPMPMMPQSIQSVGSTGSSMMVFVSSAIVAAGLKSWLVKLRRGAGAGQCRPPARHSRSEGPRGRSMATWGCMLWSCMHCAMWGGVGLVLWYCWARGLAVNGSASTHTHTQHTCTRHGYAAGISPLGEGRGGPT